MVLPLFSFLLAVSSNRPLDTDIIGDLSRRSTKWIPSKLVAKIYLRKPARKIKSLVLLLFYLSGKEQ
jgi:hypothetical protein